MFERKVRLDVSFDYVLITLPDRFLGLFAHGAYASYPDFRRGGVGLLQSVGQYSVDGIFFVGR